MNASVAQTEDSIVSIVFLRVLSYGEVCAAKRFRLCWKDEQNVLWYGRLAPPSTHYFRVKTISSTDHLSNGGAKDSHSNGEMLRCVHLIEAIAPFYNRDFVVLVQGGDLPHRHGYQYETSLVNQFAQGMLHLSTSWLFKGGKDCAHVHFNGRCKARNVHTTFTQ